MSPTPTHDKVKGEEGEEEIGSKQRNQTPYKHLQDRNGRSIFQKNITK